MDWDLVRFNPNLISVTDWLDRVSDHALERNYPSVGQFFSFDRDNFIAPSFSVNIFSLFALKKIQAYYRDAQYANL